MTKLRDRVESFDDRVSDSVIYRRLAPILIMLTLFLASSAAVATYFQGRATDRVLVAQAATAMENAVTNCLNANETRDASRTLWNFVLDLSLASNPDASPEEIGYMGEFREWIGDVYQERDCGDLSRKYELPPPPTLPVS